jgi:hypothetical protein
MAVTSLRGAAGARVRRAMAALGRPEVVVAYREGSAGIPASYAFP